MPEGPEVRTIAVALNAVLPQYQLIAVGWDDKSKYRTGIPNHVEIVNLLPAQIDGVTCKGKRLIFMFTSLHTRQSFYLTSTLGMEGKWTWKPGNHSNLWFQLSDQHKTLYYDDSRHFGNMTWVTDLNDLQHMLSVNQGPDLLAYAIELHDHVDLEADKITTEHWRQKLRSPKLANKQICELLMDQKHYSGIGNYLKSEILYRSGIRPDRTLHQLSDDDLERLRVTTLDIIYQSFQAGGLTIKSFWDPNGNKGQFQVLVYQQSVDPLGHPVHKQTFKDKRTTHWVPEIQH